MQLVSLLFVQMSPIRPSVWNHLSYLWSPAMHFILTQIIFSSLGTPSAPSVPEVLSVTKHSATIQWQPPINDGGSHIINYVVESRISGWYTWSVASSKVVPTTYTITDLAENMNYEFRVTAVNKGGRGDPSPASEACRTRDTICK